MPAVCIPVVPASLDVVGCDVSIGQTEELKQAGRVDT